MREAIGAGLGGRGAGGPSRHVLERPQADPGRPMAPPSDFQGLWRERLASGSKLAAKALAQAIKEDGSRVALIAPLTRDVLPTVRVAAYRALEETAAHDPRVVAPFAKEVVEGLAAPEPDAQAAALGTLAAIAPWARVEAALALPLIADLLKARRPGLREDAARCLGRIGHSWPESAPQVAKRLAHALMGAKTPRAAHEAREILAGLEGMLPHLAPDDRAALAPVVSTMRGHPNIQVRERAGRLAKALAP